MTAFSPGPYMIFLHVHIPMSSLCPLVFPKGSHQVALEVTLMASKVILSHSQRYYRLEFQSLNFGSD